MTGAPYILVVRRANSSRNAPAASSGASFFANAPSGWTTINDQPFTEIPVRGVNSPDAQGWSDPDTNTARFSLETDPTAPFPAHSTLKGSYPQGSAGGVAFFRMSLDFTSGQQFKNMYWSSIVQLSSNFSMNGNTGSKYIWPAGDQAEGSFTYSGFDGDGVLRTFIIQQGGPARDLSPNLGPAGQADFHAYRGTYVEIETILRSNTANGTGNGEYHQWVGGVKVCQYTDVDWFMASARTWLSLEINPTYGGGLNPVPVAGMYMKLNRLLITGSNI